MEFYLVQNRKENCYHDHIAFNLELNGNIIFRVDTVPSNCYLSNTNSYQRKITKYNTQDFFFSNDTTDLIKLPTHEGLYSQTISISIETFTN